MNVHPTKLEIRFTDELILRELITSTIGKALYQTTLIYNADEKDIKTPTEVITHTEPVVETPVLKEENINSLWDLFEDGDSDSSQDDSEDYEDDEDDDDQEDDIDEEIYQEEVFTKPSVTVQTIDLEQSIFDKLRYIGQYRKTYLLFDGGDDLYLIDQHAAMERWMYEKIKLSFEAPSNKSIELLIPITLEFGVAEIPLINEKTEELKRLGIVFEPFGRTTIVVREIPLWIPKNLEIEFISDIINHLINNQSVSKAVMYESLAKQLSCKKSIKANSSILDIEVNELLQNLKSCKMPYTCPHGRPTLVKISTYEIEKMFKRVI